MKKKKQKKTGGYVWKKKKQKKTGRNYEKEQSGVMYE